MKSGYALIPFKVPEMGNKKRSTCFATLLQNVLNSDVARFTTHV